MKRAKYVLIFVVAWLPFFGSAGLPSVEDVLNRFLEIAELEEALVVGEGSDTCFEDYLLQRKRLDALKEGLLGTFESHSDMQRFVYDLFSNRVEGFCDDRTGNLCGEDLFGKCHLSGKCFYSLKDIEIYEGEPSLDGGLLTLSLCERLMGSDFFREVLRISFCKTNSYKDLFLEAWGYLFMDAYRGIAVDFDWLLDGEPYGGFGEITYGEFLKILHDRPSLRRGLEFISSGLSFGDKERFLRRYGAAKKLISFLSTKEDTFISTKKSSNQERKLRRLSGELAFFVDVLERLDLVRQVLKYIKDGVLLSFATSEEEAGTLLSRGASCNIGCKTALYKAVKAEDWVRLNLFLEYGGNPNMGGTLIKTPLAEAAYLDTAEGRDVVRRLFLLGGNVNYLMYHSGERGESVFCSCALMRAVSRRDYHLRRAGETSVVGVEMVNLLESLGAKL